MPFPLRARLAGALAGCLAGISCGTGRSEAGCPADAAGEASFGPALSGQDSGAVFTSVLSPDGREFYFFQHAGPGDDDYRILVARRSGAGWGEPQPVDLGGPHSDLYPSLSPDGRRLVFASYRPFPGDTSGTPNAHLWLAERTATGWATPRAIAASRPGSYHSGLRQDSAGTLHLEVTSPDWRRTEAVRLRWADTAFAAQFVPDETPATDYWRGQLGDTVHVWGEVAGPDGLTLVQISQVETGGGRRPAQYFLSSRSGSGWSPLVRAPGSLGSGAPNFAWFAADGCYLHFTRNYAAFVRVAVRQLVKPD